MMLKRMTAVAICIAAFAMSAAAQTNTFPASGNVGIGTTAPYALLHLVTTENSPNIELMGFGPSNWNSYRMTFTDDGVGGGTFYNTSASYMGDVVWQMNGGSDSLSTVMHLTSHYKTGAILDLFNAAGAVGISLNASRGYTYFNGGNVGIGTTSPGQKLDVNGNIALESNGVIMPSARYQDQPGGPSGNFLQMSTMGLRVVSLYGGSDGGFGILNNAYLNSSNAYIREDGIPTAITYFGYDGSITHGYNSSWSGGGSSVSYTTYTLLDSGQNLHVVGTGNSSFAGNVGIGTTTPVTNYKLDVAGAIHSSRDDVYYPDGTQQTTAWTGVLCGGDYAEAMNAAGNKKTYGPGDVLVLADGDNGDVQKSSEPYSTTVAGIFATKPGVIGKRETLAKSSENIPMAMIGVVPTKVSAENGPIHKGDLLVSASKPGYAMKGTDRNRMLGAVLGKAMRSLDSGTGVIEVLVTLQ